MDIGSEILTMGIALKLQKSLPGYAELGQYRNSSGNNNWDSLQVNVKLCFFH
jgi:hypothetical protein